MAAKRCCGTCRHWPTDASLGERRRCEERTMLWMPKEAGLHCSDWELRKPSASKKPFVRWSKGSSLHGNVLFDGAQVHADELIDALNRARVVPPKGGGK